MANNVAGAAKWSRRNMFVVDGHAERKWLPPRHAAAIKAMIGRRKIGGRKLEISDLKRFVAGADVEEEASGKRGAGGDGGARIRTQRKSSKPTQEAPTRNGVDSHT